LVDYQDFQIIIAQQYLLEKQLWAKISKGIGQRRILRLSERKLRPEEEICCFPHFLEGRIQGIKA